MPSDSIITEFISIIRDTREQVAYLHELGVTNIEAERQLSNSRNQTVVTEGEATDGLGSAEYRRVSEQSPSPRPNRPHTESTPRRAQPAITTSPSPETLFGDSPAATPTLPTSSESFEEIWSDIGNCTRCPLYERRTNIVHTEGNRRARLMFVGEAPGADEDAQARPFVGRAGQLLTKIIEAIGFKREDVLIGNVNRCRPPGNRPPTTEEASMCKPFLLREIAAVQPEVIVVLGNTAMRNLLNIKQGITRVRGQFQDYHGVKVMPTFHPAYLLRDPSKKQETWQDLKKVRDYLETTPRRQN